MDKFTEDKIADALATVFQSRKKKGGSAKGSSIRAQRDVSFDKDAGLPKRNSVSPINKPACNLCVASCPKKSNDGKGRMTHPFFCQRGS